MRSVVALLLPCFVFAVPVAGASEFGAAHFLREASWCTAADKGYCAALHAQLAREWPQALRGDYQAQRNVAYCLAGGCDGLVVTSAPLGCAWRAVILGSGSPKITESDFSIFQRRCLDKLSPLEIQVSRAQAERLFAEIYKGRPLPPLPW